MKKNIYKIAAVAFLGAAVFCGCHIYNHFAQIEKQTEAFEDIAGIVEQAQEQAKRLQS